MSPFLSNADPACVECVITGEDGNVGTIHAGTLPAIGKASNSKVVCIVVFQRVIPTEGLW